MKKYEIAIYYIDKKGNYNYCYGWNKFDDITDLWTCIGWYINESCNVVCLNHLEYYNSNFDDIHSYINRIKENGNVIARDDKNKIIIKLEERKN